jgi:putative membrane protein
LTGFLVKWFANIIALMAVVHIVPGIRVDKWQTAVLASLALGLVNVFLRPLIVMFTLPLSIFSLGLFTFVINAFLFYSVSKTIAGFTVVDFKSAFWGALIFSILSFVISLLINPQGRIQMHAFRYGSRPKTKYRDVIDVDAKIESDDKKKKTKTK